jgi:arylsulfatase A-like enzyme
MGMPNVVVFVTDQHCFRWLGCMGDPLLKTPNLDALAAEGVLFTQAYCNTPLCMPSRATLWTGQTPRGHGVRTNGIDLEDALPTLPAILRSEGYQTISVGKIHLKSWHLSPDRTPQIHGFDPAIFPECETPWKEGRIRELPEDYFGLETSRFLGGHGSYCYGEYLNWLRGSHPEAADALGSQAGTKPSLCGNTYFSTVPEDLYYTEWITRQSMDCLDSLDPDKPFFLWCSNPDPHFPFGPPEPYSSMYDPSEVPAPVAFEDERKDMPDFYQSDWYRRKDIFSTDGGPDMRNLAQIRETKALVYGMVSLVDKSVGRIVEHLKKIGRYEDTVIVFVSDHGELMGDHGLFCKGPFHYDSLIRVPLFFHWKGHFKAGLRTDALASLLDFMPTIMDLCGITYPEGAVPDWPGPFVKNKDHAEGGIYKDTSRLPGKSLRPILEGTRTGVQDSVLVEDDDDIRDLYLRTLVTEDYKLTLFANRDGGILFDRKRDPEELRNVYNDSGYRGIREEMQRRLLDRIIETEPRLKRRIGIA